MVVRKIAGFVSKNVLNKLSHPVCWGESRVNKTPLFEYEIPCYKKRRAVWIPEKQTR
jgi:hypothetical protein